MSELQQAINEMRNMRESYDQLGAAAEAYNVGKMELAAAITGKGVETSPTESYPEMAKKVNAISQETYEINGGEMYAKQLFGSLVAPNYWNLYEVLANLLSDGRLVSYGGILLAEYYRGYDSLALAGAGAGGAYVVSDLDENGQFKMYTNDTTHTWATEFDGHGNRWVAYCFADEYHDFQITDTNTSPRSIFIGRKVGTITCLVSSRTSQIVVPDGSKLTGYKSVNAQSFFERNVGIRNIDEIGKSTLRIVNNPNTELLYLSARKVSVTDRQSCIYTNNITQLKSIILKCDEFETYSDDDGSNFIASQYADGFTFIIDCPTLRFTAKGSLLYRVGGVVNPASVYLLGLEETIGWGWILREQCKVKYIFISYRTNTKTKGVALGTLYNSSQTTTDIELKDGWCKPLDIRTFANLTKENVQAHIFDKLGVNDLSTGAVTITLATAVLNLFTQEEIDAVVARTNITIVGA